MEEPFSKSLSWQIGDNSLRGGEGGGMLYMGDLLSDHSKGGGVTQIHFLVIFIFPIMKGYTLEDKALIKIMEVLILEVNS